MSPLNISRTEARRITEAFVEAKVSGALTVSAAQFSRLARIAASQSDFEVESDVRSPAERCAVLRDFAAAILAVSTVAVAGTDDLGVVAKCAALSEGVSAPVLNAAAVVSHLQFGMCVQAPDAVLAAYLAVVPSEALWASNDVLWERERDQDVAWPIAIGALVADQLHARGEL